MRAPATERTTSTHLCEIEQVRTAALDDQVLAAFELETPRSGEQRDTWALPVSGWALGRGTPADRVIVGHRDREWSLPVHDRRPDVEDGNPGAPGAAHAGFSGAVNLLRLPPSFRLDVVAEAAGRRCQAATFSGRRAPLRTAYDPELSPLMVTSLGRTGSTWLIHLLAAHPAVAAYRPFSFEPRAATYWADVLADLAEPAAYTQQVEGDVRYPDPWWLGSGARMTSELIPDEELRRWLGSDNITELAAIAQQRIDALYLRITGADPGRPEFFAEKCLPQANVPQLLSELYPHAREVFLVRDFRDMLCSIRSFNRKRGSAAFGLDGADIDADYVQQVLAPSVQSLVDEWRARADRAHLVRYEDLLAEPAKTLRGLLDHVGVDAGADRVDDMLARSATPIPGMAQHRTAAGQNASIGRWRTELEPGLRDACDAAFGEALDEFGYARGRS
jgi:hypothetical protein